MGAPELTFINNNPPQCGAESLNAFTSEINNLITGMGLSINDSTFDQVIEAVIKGIASGNFYEYSGTANAIVLTKLGGRDAAASYFDGMQAGFIASTASTSTVTVNIDGLGVKNVKDIDGNDLTGDDIYGFTQIVYRSGVDYFILVKGYQQSFNDLLISSMIFSTTFNTGVGLTMNSDLWIPATGVELSRTDYPSAFTAVSALTNYMDQTTKDGDPETYAGYWGDGDGSTTFTAPNIALMEHLKAAGTYGSAGSSKEDHLQNLTGSFNVTTYLNATTNGTGIFSGTLTGQSPTENSAAGGSFDATFEIDLDASTQARTDTFTDTMGVFFDLYIFLPKGTFTL